MSKLVVGRVEFDEGVQRVRPLSAGEHLRTMLAHQRAVAALLEAARAYRDKPNAENIVKLAEAATRVE